MNKKKEFKSIIHIKCNMNNKNEPNIFYSYNIVSNDLVRFRKWNGMEKRGGEKCLISKYKLCRKKTWFQFFFLIKCKKHVKYTNTNELKIHFKETQISKFM